MTKNGTVASMALSVLLLFSCDNYPKDPRHTLENVKNNTLTVGVTENPPYIIFEENVPTGIEVLLLKAFAKQLNAEIKWVRGTEETLFTLLKSREIDIAAGGFSHSSIWKKHVYFVEPHDTLIFKWAVPLGRELPEDLKNKTVYVKSGSVVAAYVHQQKGHAVFLDSLSADLPLVAAPTDILEQMSYQVSGKELKKEMISFAIAKGENAFLEELEIFLAKN